MPSFVAADSLAEIASKFLPNATCRLSEVRSFGSGNINDTFLVTIDDPIVPHFVLQRINTQVFAQPELVMQNMRVFSEHVLARLQREELNRRWEVPMVLSAPTGDCWYDDRGNCWRAISFIAGTETFDTIQDLVHAEEIGYALGNFHHLVSDLDPNSLADTLVGFHITPQYLQGYDRALATTKVKVTAEVKYCQDFVCDRADWAHVLENAKAAGKLPMRVMHGDPKINNVTIDSSSGMAVATIDLDTVKPGLVHYDIGDCLRSGCNIVGEETNDLEAVNFDTDVCQAIVNGYFQAADNFLTPNERLYLYDSIRLIAFELGLRFFTDYLNGNIYFKTTHPEHNLHRAMVQFKLVESIERQESSIKKILGQFD
jgi:Ser/Thr protein kinase RdoA (MazF antagonist)